MLSPERASVSCCSNVGESRPSRVVCLTTNSAMLIDKQPYDDRPIDVNGDTAARLYMGGVLGGSTSLYGAALMRPSDDDFHPGRHYGRSFGQSRYTIGPSGMMTWRPYYDRAEQLYHVSGQIFAQLRSAQSSLATVSAFSRFRLKPINERLVNGNESAGLKPFVLPLGIDFNICLQCDACPGYICPNGARISAGQVVETSRGRYRFIRESRRTCRGPETSSDRERRSPA